MPTLFPTSYSTRDGILGLIHNYLTIQSFEILCLTCWQANSTPQSHLALSTQTLVLLLCDKRFMHWASSIPKCTYLSWSGIVIMKSTWNDSKYKKYPPITKCYHNNSIFLPPLSTFAETWSQYVFPMLVWNLLCSPGWPQTSSNSVFCHRCHYFWLDNTIFHNSHKHLENSAHFSNGI